MSDREASASELGRLVGRPMRLEAYLSPVLRYGCPPRPFTYSLSIDGARPDGEWCKTADGQQAMAAHCGERVGYRVTPNLTDIDPT